MCVLGDAFERTADRAVGRFECPAWPRCGYEAAIEIVRFLGSARSALRYLKPSKLNLLASLTSQGSQVQSLPRPPSKPPAGRRLAGVFVFKTWRLAEQRACACEHRGFQSRQGAAPIRAGCAALEKRRMAEREPAASRSYMTDITTSFFRLRNRYHGLYHGDKFCPATDPKWESNPRR